MSIEAAKKNPIDMKVADASDETLEAIIQLRKKIKNKEERLGFVKGLYYISLVDTDYTEDEKALVEGTACALGINESTLAYMEHEVNNDPDASIQSFATAGPKKYRQQLFEEMAALTYIKGYQLSAEDSAMMKVAKEMGIKEDKAEKTMCELYMAMQGFDVSTKATIAKAALGVGAIAAGAAVCAVTAGVAAPAIGAAIGGLQGLGGIAAVNAGLAALGGGAIAAGGGGVAAGTAAIVAAGAVAGGGAAAVGISVKENITAAHDKKKLQAAIRKQQKDDMTKQEITENLIKAIELEQARLKQLEELHASKRDIASIEKQIANLLTQKAELESGMEG
ncbi:Uncharacterised protein [Slackia heliotrinireducens]|uniref:Tellurite resistance protein TerB n=1 Tax=Slackia heliotrinireducens (strain ATCC 29202 / DSM 20476 / NCTC 11029 / RHS 1) TaxID=471855 RepID=C7N263_SLAHD|nr:hypothetical protein [Slackia heliotrinireducens]ACV21369.1 hypothetical protein Shel_03010 [Slackia heliotrinireducens DSM 20476]VEG98801.1 Uncharacterised protein [Slackia heliotrinireducens]